MSYQPTSEIKASKNSWNVRMLQPLPITKWKLNHVIMDFVNGLPCTSQGFGVI